MHEFLRDNGWARAALSWAIWLGIIGVIGISAGLFAWPTTAIVFATMSGILAAAWVENRVLANATNEAQFTLACSFCGLPQQQVKKLIAGPSVYICDQCVGLCNDIIVEAEASAAEAEPEGPAPPREDEGPFMPPAGE